MDYTLEIEQAKKETIDIKRQNFIRDQNRHPTDDEITPKAWFIAKWGTGFLVSDYEELLKLPKVRRNKLLSLGVIK